MGMYLNPGKSGYMKTVRDSVFLDRTEMLRHLNSVVDTERRFVFVSRPRRFGKTVAADMICAYYGRDADSRGLFEDLEISNTKPVTVGGEKLAWDRYLGAFDVVRVTVTDFIGSGTDVREGIADLVDEVSYELREAYPDVCTAGERDCRQ